MPPQEGSAIMNRAYQSNPVPSARQFLAIRTSWLVLALAALLSSTAHGQTPAIGIPEFSTQLVSETDSINPENLNVHMVIPIFAKAGRGLSLTNAFSYDSLVWTVQNSGSPNYINSWAPAGSGPGAGGLGFSGDGVFGYITWTEQTNSCGQGGGTSITRSNYFYHDPSGTAHSFVGTFPLQTCNGFQFPGATTGPSIDGSGYRLVIAPSSSSLWASIIGRDGTTAGTSQWNNAVFIWTTDANGNQITSGNSGITDTLGTIALKGYSYPQPTNPTNYVGPTFTNSSYTVRTNFGCQGVNDVLGSGQGSLLTKITLADGSYYAFTYEPTPGYPSDTTGRLASIRFPSGATVSYTYTGPNDGIACGDGSTLGLQRVTPDGTWTYTRSGSTTVLDPQGNQTIYDFAGLYTNGRLETRRRIYQGSTTLLRTVETCYNGAAFPCTTTGIDQPITRKTVRTELPDSSGLVSQVDTFYDTRSYGLVTEVDDYDFGTGGPPATPVRKTLTTYASFASNPNIQDRPLTVTVQDGSGNVKSQTTYAYDETAVTPTTGTPQHVSVTVSRGNPTTITQLVQGSTTVHRTKTYFDTGTVNSETDFAGNTTTYAYGTSSCGNSFPTQVTLPLNHTKSATWDCNGGALTSATDENSKTTSYVYGDPSFWKLTQLNAPDGGQATATYKLGTNNPWNIVQTKKITSSLTLSQKTVYDSLGRVSQHQLTSDPQGTVYTDTTYDSLGRVYSVSNPYRTGTDITTTSGITTYFYDALGRKCLEVPPGGTPPTGGVCPGTQPANDLFTTYSANTTTVTDQTGKSRKSVTDGLGRLTQVFEDPAGLNYETDYSYDTLGNLLSVNQKGGTTDTTKWRTRTFTYDSLSRLLTSNNPEVGAITYKYDSDTNCATPNSFPGLLVSKTDARSIRTCSQYDTLNREVVRNYSNGDPTITTAYDQAACLGLSTCQNIGHRTSMTDAAGSESWSYDVVDRIHKEQRTTNSVTKSATYNLDCAGNVTSVAYPTGRTVNYTFDAANRPSTAIDGSNGITYATGFKTSPGGTCIANVTCYTPQGTFYALSIGQSTAFTNGLNLTHIYNSRLQPQEFKASSSGGNAMDISYSFVDSSNHNAGHVYAITNNIDGTRSQTFSYDQLNRITAAQTTSTFATSPSHCWGESYNPDAWGNLQSLAGGSSQYTGCTYETGFTKTADGNNHLSGFSYDASGNTATDGYNSYTWDAESQLKVTAGSTYLYDGDGRRVAKANTATPPVPYKLYWYGSGGEILAETDGAGNTNNSSFNEYTFFGGQRVAMITNSGNPTYYVEDLLGTSRVITSNTGVVCYDADFYPFGGERTPYTNTCPQNYKFEGKERDTETGNDDFGARYYSNRFGRWLSADWSAVPVPVPYANLTNPQTLNLYSMVADDPESFADLDGHCLEDACIVETIVGVAVVGYVIYKGVQAYFHAKAGIESLKSGEAARGQIIDMATNPASKIDPDAAANAYKNETSKGLSLMQQAGSEANSAVSGAASAGRAAASGGPSPSSGGVDAEKAMGAGIKVGAKGVKELIKATEQKPGQQNQQQQQQQQRQEEERRKQENKKKDKPPGQAREDRPHDCPNGCL
jgi:RHS repeat-associated protein